MKKTKVYPRIGTVAYYARRQKNIRLSLKSAEIRVSYPRGLSFGKVEAFVIGTESWILKNRKTGIRLEDGLKIGRQHLLRIASQRPAGIEGKTIYVPEISETAEKLIKQALKTEAADRLDSKVREICRQTRFTPSVVRWRYMRSQWGSCSPKGVVCLNTALVYLEADLVRYVVIHELCHLQFLNHSNDFWQLVASHCPNYRELRKKLKEHPVNLVIERNEGSPR